VITAHASPLVVDGWLGGIYTSFLLLSPASKYQLSTMHRIFSLGNEMEIFLEMMPLDLQVHEP
jgi:hypothetical protein